MYMQQPGGAPQMNMMAQPSMMQNGMMGNQNGMMGNQNGMMGNNMMAANPAANMMNQQNMMTQNTNMMQQQNMQVRSAHYFYLLLSFYSLTTNTWKTLQYRFRYHVFVF